jgi:hypothetical protein
VLSPRESPRGTEVDTACVVIIIRRKFSRSIRSWRLSADLCDDCEAISEYRTQRGAGVDYAPRYKLEHDVEQFTHLAAKGIRPYWLNHTVIPAYRQVRPVGWLRAVMFVEFGTGVIKRGSRGSSAQAHSLRLVRADSRLVWAACGRVGRC